MKNDNKEIKKEIQKLDDAIAKVKELVEKGKFNTSVNYSFDKDGNVL